MVLGGRLWGRARIQPQRGVFHPQGPQEFNEGPIRRSVMGPPSQDADGQGAAPQPRQDRARLGEQGKRITCGLFVETCE